MAGNRHEVGTVHSSITAPGSVTLVGDAGGASIIGRVNARVEHLLAESEDFTEEEAARVVGLLSDSRLTPESILDTLALAEGEAASEDS